MLFGSDVGTVATLSFCGFIIETYGWKWGFYAPAIYIALFGVLTYFVVYDSPAQHPRITDTEREFIESELKGRINNADDDKVIVKKIMKQKFKYVSKK